MSYVRYSIYGILKELAKLKILQKSNKSLPYNINKQAKGSPFFLCIYKERVHKVNTEL